MLKKQLSKYGLINSIRGKLIFYFGLLLIIPLSALALMSYQEEKEVIKTRVINQLSSIADSRKPIIENWLQERVNDTVVLANDPLVRDRVTDITAKDHPDKGQLKRESLYLELRDKLIILSNAYGYSEATLFDKSGRALVSSVEDKVGTYTPDAEYFSGGLTGAPGQVHITDVFYSEDIGGPAIAFSLPIRAYRPGQADVEGEVVGVAALIYNMDKTFYPLILSWPGIGNTGETLLVRREGGDVMFLNRLKYVDDAPLKFSFPASRGWPKPALLSSGGLEGNIETVDYRGEPIIASYRYIPLTKWGYVVKIDSSEAFAPIRKFGIKVAVLFIASVVFIGVLIFVISRKIVEPITALDESSRRFAKGDFSVSLPPGRNDEIGSLTRSFKKMAEDLKAFHDEVSRKSRELENSNRELSTLAESLEEKVKERTTELLESRNRIKDYLDIVERANVELRRLDGMKDHFLGMMSHELRTPLSLIIGHTSNILSDRRLKLDPAVEESLEGVYKGAERLRIIVSEMLDVSQIDARGMRLEFIPADTGAVIKNVLRELETFIKGRKQVVVLGDFSAVPYLSIDKKRMYQVFTNIIGNAIKFTPDGGRIEITPRVYTSSQRPAELQDPGFAGSDFVDIEVKDSGIGLDKEELDRIFDKFYEVGDIEKHATSKYGFLGRGMGLGLPIARGIVEAHNGKLWVQSKGYDPVKCPGSIFHILLPIGKEARLETAGPEKTRMEARPEPAAAARPVAEARAVGDRPRKTGQRPGILLIEDDPDILRMTTTLLKGEFDVYEARDGYEGLDMARERHPDLVLLDVYMEGMDGYEVCERLKSNEATSDITVAFFSAGAQRHEVEMGFKAGADDYITKPFKPDEFIERVKSLVGGSYQSSPK